MAREFEVPFLGSVPIDPQFVMLVETGKRPVYPVGTNVNGIDVGNGKAPDGGADTATKTSGETIEEKENGASTKSTNEENNSTPIDERTQGLLVEKYQSCSLAHIFSNITAQVMKDCESQKQTP